MTYSLKKKSFRHILIAVILASGIALSILVSLLSYSAGEKLRQEQFNNAVENRYFAMKREIDNNLRVLESFQDLCNSSEHGEGVEFLERVEFQEFAKHILKGHASIQTLELIPRMPDSRRRSYESAARRDGFPGFQLTERSAQGKMKRAEKRKEYFPICFVEPYAGNETDLGFDLSSDPVRMEALEAARKTGKMIATARISLPRETKNKFGFIVFAPVYRKGTMINTDQERWDNLEGFALAVFRTKDIIEKATGLLKPEGIDFIIYDASASEKERLLYSHESRMRNAPLPNNEQSGAGYKITKTLEVAGRKWMINYSATPEFYAARSNSHHWGFLLAGLAVTGLVAGFLIFSAKHAEQAEKSARDISHANAMLTQEMRERKQAEEALRESEERFKKLFLEAPLGIAMIDSLTGQIYEVNLMFAKIAGRTLEKMATVDWMTITHPDDIQKDLDNMALLNAGKITGFQMEKRYLHHDGAAVWINMTIAALYVKDKAHPRHLCMIEDITERKKAQDELQRYSAELEKSNRLFQEALADVKTLSGMLPICASCKKIRDDKGYWSQVETYVSEHTEAVFSHGMCPDCEKKAYEELEKLKKENT